MWVKYPAQGYTAQGWPIWDWSKGESGPQADGMDSLYLLKDGSVLTLHRGGGDKYTARDTYAPGHGWQWPANGTDGAALCRWDAQGHKLWQVGTKAARREAGPGRLHYPIRISGELPGFVAVCDKIVKPCEFWSDDGLYVGGLLDKRVEDALPARLYVWWQAGKDDFDPQLGRAALQYDMILGGSLVPWAKDEALFLGAGWNNVPVFKITGFDKIERQHDSITLRGEPPRARGTGTGPRLWFEPSRKGFEQPVGNWTGFVEPLFNEAYTFAVYAVGQAKVSLDGKLIIDGTAAKAKGLWKQFSAPVHLQAGAKVPFAVEFQGSELHVCWESLTQSIEHVPATALYPAADR
jgi:hypothetical protein